MISVLFARRDSIYKTISGLDVYDADRNALTYAGHDPVIAHPPCRAWGRLAHLAKPLPGERDLAYFALRCVRSNGGVLEHPVGSRLFYEARLPPPFGLPDEFGWITVQLDQCDFGHPCRKATLCYIVGTPISSLPSWPVGQGVPTHCLTSSIRPFPLPEAPRYWREATPPAFAHWLIQVAAKSAARA